MYHKKMRLRRMLSASVIVALLAGLLPPAVAEAAVSDHIVPLAPQALHPQGITVDLFDYWLDAQDAPDDGKPENGAEMGINKDHVLNFGKNMGRGNPNSADFNINWWTESAQPKTDIVKRTLGDDGYPQMNYVSATEQGDGESLAYLFNGVSGAGKQAFINTGGLLRQNSAGYYTYDSKDNFAVFNAATNSFTLYDAPGVVSSGSSRIMGQFFPFNTGEQVFGERDGQLFSTISSANRAIKHYFGLHMTTRFQQPAGGENNGEPVTFGFTGDDDVWIFIDGVRVADLGGNHNACSVAIDFAQGGVTVYDDVNGNGAYDSGDRSYDAHTLRQAYAAAGADTSQFAGETYADNSYHTLDFFYLERGNTDSNMEMTFNLATIPGSDLAKTDQDGAPVEGAEFALYDTDADYTVAENAQPLVRGTTDAGGSFPFYRSDGSLLSLGALSQGHYLLRETKVSTGYRSAGDIQLWLEKRAGLSGLLLSQNEWDTGAYAMAKARVSTGLTVEDVDGGSHDAKNGVVFAAVFKGADAARGPEGYENCQVVYGDPVNGWFLSENTGKEGLREAAEAIVANPEMQGIYRFQEGKQNSDAVNNFYTILENLPGDITRYYWVNAQGAGAQTQPVDYTIAFFYLDSDTLTAAQPADIALLKSDDFTRDFAVTLFAPNIENRLLVQKVDADTGAPLDGATFALYDAADVVQGAVRDGAKPVMTSAPTGSYQLGAQTIPGVAVLNRVPLGQYVLLEDQVPDGYTRNPAAVEIVVDETGVHANAGTAEDDIGVTLGLGKVVKSMVQFAADDQIDATLHDVNAALQTAETYDGAKTDWRSAAETPLQLSYQPQAYGALEYGVPGLDLNDGVAVEQTLTRHVESGWSRLLVTQDRDAVTANTYKQDLGDQPLNACFSGTTMVTVGDVAALPEQPGDPDQPSDDPETPDHPETPNDPDQPSDQPDEPDAPDQPNEPEQPDAPDQPSDDPDQPPLDPDGPDDLNTTDHFYYIVGYPEDYRTGAESWDESRWPVKPQGAITRAEVATMFYRLLKKDMRAENETADNAFHDVNADDWFNVPVSTLSRMGIIGGYPSGDFQPNAPISRAEFAAVATRFFENTDIAYEEGLFSDIRGDEWFAKNFAAAFRLGLIGGYPDGSARPARTITRAEACAIVNRTLQRVPEKDHLRPTSEMRTWPDNSDTNAWYYADMQEATNGHDYEWRTANKKRIEKWTRIRPDFNWDAV